MLEFLQSWGGLILSGVSIAIAVISFIKSSKAQKLQNKVNELDTRIKEYELEKIKQEKAEAVSSVVKARAIKVDKNNYRLKIYNAGNTIAHNVSAKISKEYNVMLLNDKMPFEELEPQNGFEECLVVHMGSSPKFKVQLNWQDDNGHEHNNEQFCSI